MDRSIDRSIDRLFVCLFVCLFVLVSSGLTPEHHLQLYVAKEQSGPPGLCKPLQLVSFGFILQGRITSCPSFWTSNSLGVLVSFFEGSPFLLWFFRETQRRNNIFFVSSPAEKGWFRAGFREGSGGFLGLLYGLSGVPTALFYYFWGSSADLAWSMKTSSDSLCRHFPTASLAARIFKSFFSFC